VIATEYVVKAKADGYTILYNSFAWITNQLLIKELPYKPTDLAPVTLLGRYPLALFVQGGLPVSNLAEFIEYAKKKNQPLTFGNAGVGSSMHLAALEFSSLTGLKIMSVPYKGSIAALNDVMGKQIDAIFEGEVYRPHTETGRVKALFVGQPERMSGWALPSATEAGLPKFNMSSWFGLMVPSETPIAIREKLATDVTAVLRQPDVRERLRVLGLLSAGMTSAEYGTYLETESVKLGAFVERNRADLQ
jgi:tripartite-type tricarboxylate transporter receptor subunit TctC